MNPKTLHVLDYTLNAKGGLATITIATSDNLESYVYTTTFLKTIDNTIYSEGNTYDYTDPDTGIVTPQRNPNNGF